MTTQPPKRSFKLSRLETFLGLAVLLGLGYMVFIFGLSPNINARPVAAHLDEKSIVGLAELAQHQRAMDRDVAELKDKLTGLSPQVECTELAELKTATQSLADALSLIESRLSELQRLLPKPILPPPPPPAKK